MQLSLLGRDIIMYLGLARLLVTNGKPGKRGMENVLD